ncbi:MAG: indole-3-glycerol phosphate synthase TrpC [Planctomycetota bacterium]|nr:MAG: indole-3-glycerol phosphate synthase TrpC [Planctomycetota bacterium]
MMGGILARIIEHKRREVEQAIRQRPLRDLMQAADAAPPTRDFLGALRRGEGVRLIAEVKKASPSKGVLREDFDPVALGQGYASGGASCLSVLTDRDFFQGDLEYLQRVRQAVDLPVLRKDFIVHPYQVFEARVAGADAILLIAECLTRQELRGLYSLARDLGMAVLIELYHAANLDNVLHTGTELIGINNRDLDTFEVDLQHTIRLRPQIPAETIVVSESGIHCREDVQLLQDHGVQAMLVGESLVRQSDVASAVRRLLGTAPAA